jgi:hypothetical protein
MTFVLGFIGGAVLAYFARHLVEAAVDEVKAAIARFRNKTP